MRRISALVLALLLLLLSCGCTATADFDAGEQLTAAELAALKEQLAAQKEQEDAAPSGGGTSEDGMVFWLDSGKVYHTDATCYHIAKKQNVKSGTVDEATAAGKERVCASCAGD